MDLFLYNTLSKKKEKFQSIEEGKVKMYACGITVYDRCHLGHARGAVNFDVLRKLFKALGYDVTYARNYTDIDDKIIKRANERGISTSELTEEMIRYHDEDMGSLGIEDADIKPKATEEVPTIIKMVEELVAKGFAYESEGDVFFRVRKYDDYGKLSGKNIDDLASGIRIEINSTKEDPLDFVLWKSAKPGEPSWESPWGAGRPGWHIECSAMGKCYLGETFDIHAGGSDLIFPHHENEIAQSECANGTKFVNYWVHNGMIKIQGQKMAKSLGNFATIYDLVQVYHPELLRFFILSAQYRHSLNFNDDGLKQAMEGLDRIYKALEKYETTYGKQDLEGAEVDADFKQRFFEALCDDLNTPKAISVLFELTRLLNSEIDNPEKAKLYYCSLLEYSSVLGLLKYSALDWFKSPRIKTEEEEITAEEIEELIEKRRVARAEKNWALADEIRDRFKELNISIEDREGKTFWSRK